MDLTATLSSRQLRIEPGPLQDVPPDELKRLKAWWAGLPARSPRHDVE